MIPVRLRDHVFYTAFAPYHDPKVAMALILENGGSEDVVAAPVVRQILDHIFLPDKEGQGATDKPTAGALPAA